MSVNAAHFTPPQASQTFLRARGFAADGSRSGGVKDPKMIGIRPGSVLIRLFREDSRKNGEWWSTPAELAEVVHHFAVGAPRFGEGRSQGQGILQATLAVRHFWGDDHPEHLSRFWVARTTAPMQCFVGEGDVAMPDGKEKTAVRPGHTAAPKGAQKAVDIFDRKGRRRGVRQVFLPKQWDYAKAFTELYEGKTDTDLIAQVQKYDPEKVAGADD